LTERSQHDTTLPIGSIEPICFGTGPGGRHRGRFLVGNAGAKQDSSMMGMRMTVDAATFEPVRELDISRRWRRS
jgi:hypothetical protein